MSMILHPATGFEIGDPDRRPLDPGKLPSAETLREAASGLVLSASGWRMVFARPMEDDPFASWTGDRSAENCLGPSVSDAGLVLAAGMAKVFGDYILRGSTRPAILLGLDSRPTGPALADVFARVLIGMGIEVRYLFISCAPEIMAYSAYASGLPEEHPERAEGFVYISASHNPPGHNGVKFGRRSGGVLPVEEVLPLIKEYRAFLQSPSPAADALAWIAAAPREEIARCYYQASQWKRHAVSAYTLFSHRVISGMESLAAQDAYLDALAEACEKRPLGIVGELNGSARSLSIDKSLLEGIGVRCSFHNNAAGRFAHRIVPEGESLFDCMELLDQANATDPSYQLGYVPDCDGDRGNLVFFDSARKKSRALEAQEVFALACLAELADLARRGKKEKIAVAVNDATSMRVEEIASRFGARVFRAETGEANVVSLADSLRNDGWTVRILGEGSNGGNISYPSRVRDPLSTIGAMIRLLRMPGSSAGDSLFGIWCAASGISPDPGEEYEMRDIIETLPVWATTSIFESRAALTIRSADKVRLKSAVRDEFLAAWPARLPELSSRYGIRSWRAFGTKGTAETEIGDDFAASGTGGLRIVMSGEDGKARAFLWMRGSGTEPVFRIMADVAGGSAADEAYFLDWLGAMVRSADARCSGGA